MAVFSIPLIKLGWVTCVLVGVLPWLGILTSAVVLRNLRVFYGDLISVGEWG